MTLKIEEFDKIILGIDPGTNIMGYGLIGINGKQMKLISIGIIKLAQYDNHSLKLKYIFERITGIIENFFPDEVVVEAPFFGKNVQSMLKLGRAQGVAIAAALSKNLPIFEYSPRKIKQSVCGKGSASKEQVASMLQHLLKFEEMPNHLDATDALAVAVCHYNQFTPSGFGIKKSAKNNWGAFIKDNPNRIK